MLKSFQELEVWRKAHTLRLKIYNATREFPSFEQFGVTSQFRRAASSIATNIADGFGRRSTKDSIRFLEFAGGSLEETRDQLILSRDLTYLLPEKYAELSSDCDEVGRLLGGLIASLRRRLS